MAKNKMKHIKLLDKIKKELVEVHTKAYYNAIKQIEIENHAEKKSNEIDDVTHKNETKEIKSIWDTFTYLAGFLFVPKRTKKKFGLTDNLTETVFRVLMASLLYLIGVLQRIIAILLPIVYIITNRGQIEIIKVLVTILWGILLGYLGSIAILMSDEMILEKNENRIQGLFTFFAAVASLVITILPILAR